MATKPDVTKGVKPDNTLVGTIQGVEFDKLFALVKIKVQAQKELFNSIMTRKSFRRLKVQKGSKVNALVRTTNVVIKPRKKS
jgi:molybdopterin-binding protein